jgi:hypothetical protein
MRVIVAQHHGDSSEPKVFQGSPVELVEALIRAYPWLVSQVHGDTDLENLVKVLDASQAYTAVIQDSDINLIKAEINSDGGVLAQILGQHVKLAEALAAASFLTGKTPNPEDVRRALVENESDPEVIALRACGLEATSDELEALRAILKASLESSLKKGEAVEKDEPVKIEKIEAVVKDGILFAEAVKRAAKDNAIFPIKLGVGKHTNGTLLAWDKEHDKQYLLKPGSGLQNPAAGASECGASQSEREVAFSAIAAAWGLSKYVLESQLLLLDGKKFACTPLLPLGYKNLNTLRTEDKTLPKRLFLLSQLEGIMHRWSTLDYVLGNVDSHSGNIMALGDKVVLIDHGSAFAGKDFSPLDKYTFIPAYLRAVCPDNFKGMTPEEKLKALPRVSPIQEVKLKGWILGLDDKILAEVCYRYGTDPLPEINRLNSLKGMCLRMPADLAINSLWAGIGG